MTTGDTTTIPGPAPGTGPEPADPPVDSAALRALARTDPDPALTHLLAALHHARTARLLHALRRALPEGPARTPWRILDAAHARAPRATGDVLHYPATTRWAEETLRRLDTGTTPAPDLGRLGALAAAAALRAGIPFTLAVRPDAGRLHLPTLGVLHPDTAGPLTLTPDTWTRRPDTARALHTLPDRHTTLDDLDPYRGPAHPAPAATPARRLTPPGHHRWDVRFAAARTLLDRCDPDRAPELTALLRAVVPLAGAARTHPGPTPAHPGAALLRAQAPPALAAALIRELHHAKLAILGAAVPLHTADPEPRHPTPWHPAPRCLDGLLHDAYGRLALAAHWQRAAQYGERGAHARHLRCRAELGAVLPALAAHPRLTAAGREFTACLLATHQDLARRR
ncbi:aKG-HExxH-type peptide beta-hydroxylase [Streptomyces sp. BI20]|uniref:aKG-HExxH-type peptide beta-hydroxylase n=1 Tax=Streptomyces sp. BI20 TaxID=3403460 RepID=UPI003C70C4A3